VQFVLKATAAKVFLGFPPKWPRVFRAALVVIKRLTQLTCRTVGGRKKGKAGKAGKSANFVVIVAVDI